jgi:Prohead core protein serine protease
VAKVYLTETCAFVPDPGAIRQLREDRAAGKSLVFPLPIPGRLSICDEVNGNNRIYPTGVWTKNIQEGSPLQKSIQSRSSFGLLEHPKDGKIDLNSPISHVLTRVWMEAKEVHGEITLVDTMEGRKLSALIQVGYNPLVSSRGYGSVVPNERGIDVVQEDFVCESWDAVFNPSFEKAVLQPNREEASRIESKAPAAKTPLTEQAGATAAVPATTVNVTVDGAPVTPTLTASGAPAGRTQPTTPMPDIKSIQESVSRLRNVDPAKLDPKRFAEGLSEAEQLHRDVAALVADNPKLSYDGRRIDDELNGIEKAFAEAAQAPGKQATALQEQLTKALKVLKSVAETGLVFKGKLAEALKEIGRLKEARLADARRRALLERKVNVTCAALDEMARRYHEDTTALGARVLILEFNPSDEVKKRISAATKPVQLIPIRDELKKIREAADPGKEKKGGSADAVGKVASDMKEEPAEQGKKAAPEPSKGMTPTAESKTAKKTDETPTVVESSYPTQRPFSVMESASLATRLSEQTKALLTG